MNVVNSISRKDQDVVFCEILLYTPVSKDVNW